MEINFPSFQSDSEFSYKVTITDSEIKGGISYPDSSKKISAIGADLSGLASGILRGFRHEPSMLDWVYIRGHVEVQLLKSISYRYFDGFSLELYDNNKNGFFFQIKQPFFQFYHSQHKELLEKITQVSFPVIMNNIFHNLSNERPINIAGIYLYINGVQLDWHRLFKRDKVLVSWSRLNYKIKENKITISEYNSSSIKSEINTGDYNACLIPSIIDFMKNRHSLI